MSGLLYISTQTTTVRMDWPIFVLTLKGGIVRRRLARRVES